MGVFINEFHYDNTGTDTGEAIEIAGPAGTDLTGWTIVLYNGANGASYATLTLSGTIPDLDDGFGAVSVLAPGLQNGAPDGFALVDPSNAVVQFLSYEGTLTATNGPAAGLTSTDIGMAENGTEAVGLSLQLVGNGIDYTDFTWQTGQIASFGGVNAGQNFAPPAAPPSVFINEFHYDNSGTDANEFIEIAGTAGADLTGWSLVLYNGSNGAVYDTKALSGVIADTQNGFGTLSFSYPVNGIQNGSPDAIALVRPDGTVAEFLSYEGTLTAVGGPADGLTSVDIGVSENGTGTANGSLYLTGTGNKASDFTWAVNGQTSTAGAVNAGQSFTAAQAAGVTVAIDDVSITEGDAGTSVMTFTVTRSTNTTAFSVDFATTDIEALAGSDYAATSGTLNFAVGGALSQKISVTINGDVIAEPNESFAVSLSNLVQVAGTTGLADGQGIGTILNDELVRIHDIQGAAHVSPLLNQTVTTTGIVTAVDSNGFYLQERDTNVDASDATSEAIFVFTSTAPTVAVGDDIRISGRVSEFTPGGASSGNLSITQLIGPFSITVQSSGNALPTATVLGLGGRTIPTENIDDDGRTVFDPENDGIDFFESLEGMRVTVPSPVAVSASNGFGEVFTVADNGINATNLSQRGTINIDGSIGDGLAVTNSGPGSDFNPERIQIDADPQITGSELPVVNVGTRFNDITGILNYSFGNYEVIPTSPVTVAQNSALIPEVTALKGDQDTLTVATFNVFNLDPNDADGDQDIADGRFTMIARQIVDSLNAPDIIALQEVQDNSGSRNDGTVSASLTLETLVNEIFKITGKMYSYVDNPFITNNTNGGEPGGNIRTAFLYDPARVTLTSVNTTPDAVADFAGARIPLVGNFDFQGNAITIINNHFTSKGGSTDLYGSTQPSLNGGSQARLTQAQNVADYVKSLGDAANVIVLGDLNEFENEESLAPLSNDASLLNLGYRLPEEERYSYIFEGNSQQLDHIFASSRLAANAAIDMVHINSEFAEMLNTASDHDPVLAAFTFAPAAAASLTTTPTNNLVLTAQDTLALAGAEISAYDPTTKRAFVTSSSGLQVIDLSNPQDLSLIGVIDFSAPPFNFSNDVNSVAVANGIIAVAVAASVRTDNGRVILLDAQGNLLNSIEVGALPDNLVFTPDGKRILVANEGEATFTEELENGAPYANPEGSISIIDLSEGAASATVQTAGFGAFNSQVADLLGEGVRLFVNSPGFEGITVAQDLEPEYIAVSADGLTAFVTLQEANSIAIVDIATAEVTDIVALGLKSWFGLPFDGSDRDGGAVFQTDQRVFGLYQPDAIASFTGEDGKTYYITANEGDDRDDFVSETERLSSLTLDPTQYPEAAALLANAELGRLTVPGLPGVNGDIDGDGDIDQILAYGGRSFSILDENGNRIFDSGSQIEEFIAAAFPGLYDNGRGDNKGAEPEGVTTGVINGRVYAFVGLERYHGTMVYDVTDPRSPVFVTFATNPGDTNPEGSVFIAAADSPTGEDLLLVSNENSNTLTLYKIAPPNVAPVGVDDVGDALVEDELVISTGNVLANDTDANAGDMLSVIAVRAGTEGEVAPFTPVDGLVQVAGVYGTLTIAADGSYSYLLDSASDITNRLSEGEIVVEAFTYQLSDEDGASDAAELRFSITGTFDGLTLTGGAGKDVLTGNFDDDILSGLFQSDTLSGLEGDDRLFGGFGNDVLLGGDGDDYLDGGFGNDDLFGGAGSDTFVFGSVQGRDIVYDFDTSLDSLLLVGGDSIRKSRVNDANDDGILDLTIDFRMGGSVVLLGVDNFDDVLVNQQSGAIGGLFDDGLAASRSIFDSVQVMEL